jgi:hypothetical protein
VKILQTSDLRDADGELLVAESLQEGQLVQVVGTLNAARVLQLRWLRRCSSA